jgi:hypothetical protein
MRLESCDPLVAAALREAQDHVRAVAGATHLRTALTRARAATHSLERALDGRKSAASTEVRLALAALRGLAGDLKVVSRHAVRTPGHDPSQELWQARASAREMIAELEEILPPVPRRWTRVSARAAVQVLPRHQRSRYLQECLAELEDLPARQRPGYLARLALGFLLMRLT